MKEYSVKQVIRMENRLQKFTSNTAYEDFLLPALIMFGVPNQTKESIEYTLDFLYDHDLVVRPTAYTPFYEMNHNMNAEQLSKYDKRTYYEGIPGLEYGDFLRLIYNTEEYKKILRKGE